jgi:hypothetical protein
MTFNQENAIANVLHQIKRNSGYLARQEIETILDKISINPNRLELYGFKVYSQNDEDGIIEAIFYRLGIQKGTFLEIGVGNGLECNSLYLIHKGWKGAWVEGDDSQKDFIENKFYSLLYSKRLVYGVGYVTRDNVNDVVSSALTPLEVIPDDLDFLSIDIDGMDIYLLEALTIKPKVICIEYNGKFPPTLYKKPVYNESNSWVTHSDYLGSSLLSINEVAVEKGYRLVGTNITGANAFFVRKDLLSDKFDKYSTVFGLYNPARYWLFHDHFESGIGHRADFGRYTDLE